MATTDASQTSTLAPDGERPGRFYKGWVLLLLLLTYTSSYVDRTIIGVLQEPIKQELGLTDGQLGLLGGLSFAFFYTTLAIPIARLAERYSRKLIISISLISWSVMTTLCGVSQTYLQLLLCRIGVGIGEAGGNPASHSLITDIFSRHRYATAIAIFSLGAPLGSLIGGVLGGAISQGWGWRTAFLVVGPPGVLLALLILATVREPVRGRQAAAPAGERADDVPPLMAVVQLLAGSPVFVHFCAGASLLVLAGYCIALFMSPFFLREFGLPIRDVGLISGVVNGIAAGIGVVAGGFICDRLGRNDRRFYAWIPALCLMMAGPLFMLAFLQPGWRMVVGLLAAATALIYVHYGPTYAVVHSMVEPRMRATAAAIMFMVVNLVGVGFGPPIAGFASDLLAASAFAYPQAGAYADLCPGGIAPADAPPALREACAQASARGLRNALVLCSGIFLWSALHFVIAGFRIGRPAKATVSS